MADVTPLTNNPVIIQFDLGQLITAIGAGSATFLGACALVGRMFVKYMESKDVVQRKSDEVRDQQIVKMGTSVERLAETVQSVNDQKDGIVKAESASWREQSQKVNDGLIELIKQVMTVTAQLRSEVEKAGGTQLQTVGELQRLTEAVRQNTEATKAVGGKRGGG